MHAETLARSFERTALPALGHAIMGRLAVAATLLLVTAPALSAQERDTTVYSVDPVIVTATRGPRVVSETPRPVSVLQPRDIAEQLPNTVSDLFRLQPGLDVTGVGVSQVRPQIRGQGGQRILLLNDGLRMNNTRRQNDFGELPALVDVGAVDHVEVVRGPSSVLYGSDAIGGVINIMTKVPTEEGFGGSASYLFGSAGQQNKVAGRVEGRSGAFSLTAGGSWRTADAYDAPSGSFGDITMPQSATVLNSGVTDYNFDARLGWDFGSRVGVFGKVEHYNSEDAGFGFLPPDAYNPGAEEIDITYPSQVFTKFTAGLESRELDFALADVFNVTTYGQDNERDLFFYALFPAGPGASVELANHNFTDIRTYGARVEARKLVMGELLLTYGVDGFRDDATGTDNDTTTLTGFGPPPPMVIPDDTPSIPDAHFLSVGYFVQAEVDLDERLSVVAGGRYQDVTAESFATEGLDVDPAKKNHSALVGALNLMYDLTDEFSLVGSVGRGFRSPNLVELFFEGAVPEGDAYQLPAQDLDPEKSLNFDLGFRYQNDELFVEAFGFHNKVYDGIRSRPVVDPNTGDTLQTGGFDTYQGVNVDKILILGYEVNADYRLPSGLAFGTSFSYVDAEDVIDSDNPVGESYSNKITGRVGYRDPAGRFWTQFEARHNGKQRDAAIPAGNPLGQALPAFDVLNLRGGFRLPDVGNTRQSVSVAVNNLTNELYAESSNASFFRPEPKRNVTVSLNVAF